MEDKLQQSELLPFLLRIFHFIFQNCYLNREIGLIKYISLHVESSFIDFRTTG